MFYTNGCTKNENYAKDLNEYAWYLHVPTAVFFISDVLNSGIVLMQLGDSHKVLLLKLAMGCGLPAFFHSWKNFTVDKVLYRFFCKISWTLLE
jgi:hypothetical protein